MPTRPVPPTTLLAAVTLYHQGCRQDAIAKRLGISPASVSRALSRAGLSQAAVLKHLRSGLTPEQILSQGSAEPPPPFATDWKALHDRQHYLLREALATLGKVRDVIEAEQKAIRDALGFVHE